MEELRDYLSTLSRDGCGNKERSKLIRLLQNESVTGIDISVMGRTIAKWAETWVEDEVFRVFILSDYTTTEIANGVRVALFRQGLRPVVQEGVIGVIDQEILNTKGNLAQFKPSLVVIFPSAERIIAALVGVTTKEEMTSILDQFESYWTNLWSSLQNKLEPTIWHHAYVPPEGYTDFASETIDPIWELNKRLSLLSLTSFEWLSLDNLISQIGYDQWVDPRFLNHGDFPFSPQNLNIYSQFLARPSRNLVGAAIKVMVLDLDNTLWGGTIGDDGLDGIELGPETAIGRAYWSFCTYIKRLRVRGITLCICSKNDPNLALDVFRNHRYMPLTIEDFSLIKCNWNDKATNFSEISDELNVGTQNMMFVDDSFVECDLVSRRHPLAAVIHLGDDPSLFIRKVSSQSVIDWKIISDPDGVRQRSYLSLRQAESLRAQSSTLEEFLASLGMVSTIRCANMGDLDRLSQMEARNNQFNLSTRRLSKQQLENFCKSDEFVVLVSSLRDRFTDHGLVSHVVFQVAHEKLVVTDWTMSCRVFSRTLESTMWNSLVTYASNAGKTEIVMRFRSTNRNHVMRRFFQTLGLGEDDIDSGEDLRVGIGTVFTKEIAIKVEH